MAAASMHTVRRLGQRLLGPRPVSGRRGQLLTFAAVLGLSLVAAHSIAGMSGQIPKPLAAILIAADVVLMFALAAEQLLLGWLFLAPLLQESAGKTHLGHVLGLALYTAPPLVFALKALLVHGSRPRREWFDFLPALFVFFVFASLVVTSSSSLKTGAVGTMRGFYQTVALGAILYYAAAFWRGRPLPTIKICWVVLASAGLQAAMVIVEWRTGWNLWHDSEAHAAGDVRASGTLTNPSLTGAFIGVGFVVALAVFCWAGPLRLKRIALVMLVLGLPALYGTKTRGPIVATLIASAAIVLLSRRTRPVGIAAITVASLAVALFWPQIKSSSVYQNRVAQSQNVQIRLILQEVSIRLAEEKPILGWGYNSFDRVKYTVPIYSSSVPVALALFYTSHDSFLTILVDYGGVGLILFVLPFVLVMWRSWRRARLPSPQRWFFVAGLASIAVVELDAATLDYRFFSFVPALGWLFLGLMRREVSVGAVSG
jgi:O-antigen ligase